MNFFDPKTPNERRTLTFDFADDLPSGVTVESTVAMSVVVYRGTDASPAEILNGTSSLAGSMVMQSVDGGNPDTDYLVASRVTYSDGQIAELMAVLPVRAAI